VLSGGGAGGGGGVSAWTYADFRFVLVIIFPWTTKNKIAKNLKYLGLAKFLLGVIVRVNDLSYEKLI